MIDPQLWRPPVAVRVIAVCQALAGIVLAGFVAVAVGKGEPIPAQFVVMTALIVAAAVYGGMELWHGTAAGFLISSVLQLLQVVMVYGQRYSFALLLGPGIVVALPSQGQPTLGWMLRASYTWAVNQAPVTGQPVTVINVLAPIAVLVLLRAWRQSGRMVWRRGVSWDRARLIGAYQIGAGTLGVFNATARASGAIYLLFSVLVIASGVALVRRMRRSDAIAVGINALQVPALSFGGFTYLLRSGVSFIVALSSGANQLGLQFRLDVGAVPGDPLAPGIEHYIGVNVVAMILAIALIDDLGDEPDIGIRHAAGPAV